MYGIPYLYTLTHRGRILLGANKREDKIRIDRITHDIYVIDAVICFLARDNLTLKEIESEKELHIKDGFGNRKHQPDFIIKKSDQKWAVEFELNPKTKTHMEQNVRSNYLNFDRQLWLTDHHKVLFMLDKYKEEYSNIEIISLEDVIKK